MNPTTLIRCVAATLAATTLLLAQSAPLPSKPRTTDKPPERSSERMQVRLAEVIAMLEEDDLSPEQRAQAKKKLEEIVARLREAPPTTPMPPGPAAAPRSPQATLLSPRTEVVELAPPSTDAPRARVLRLGSHVDSDPVARMPQDPASPPVAPKAEKAPKPPKPAKTPKPPKADTTEALDPVEMTETETRRPVPQDVRRLEAEKVEAARHADELRAEAARLREMAERLHAEAHGQNEEARVLRSKADQEKRTADSARAEYSRARATAPEAEAKRDGEASRVYRARAQENFERDVAAKAEKQAKDNAGRTYVYEVGGEQKAPEARAGARQAPGRQLEARSEGGETRAIETARARMREVQGQGGDDAEIRALIDQMRAEMREIRDLIQQMRKQTSAAPRSAGAQNAYGLGGGTASGSSPFGSGNAQAPSGLGRDGWWEGSGSSDAANAPTKLKWTSSGKGQASGGSDAGSEGAGTSSNTTTPMLFQWRRGPDASGGTTVPMKADFRTWNVAK